MKTLKLPMLFNGCALIFTFSGTKVRIAEHERLQSLFVTLILLLRIAWQLTAISAIVVEDIRNQYRLNNHCIQLVVIIITAC